MAGSHTIDAWYVRQTQNTQNKTDYFEEVEPGTEEFKGVLKVIQGLHRSLAAVESTTGRSGVVGYALDSKRLGSVICLSRTELKGDRSARPYVEMQTLVARADEAERLGLSAVDLFLAANWDRLAGSKDATVSLMVPPRWPPKQTPEIVELLGLIFSRFAGKAESPMEWPGNLAPVEVATMVREAMLQIEPEGRVRATFAWGIPRACKLPMTLSIVIDDGPGKKKRVATTFHTVPVSPTDLLAQLDSLSFGGRPVPAETAELFWELRLSLARRRIRADALTALGLPGPLPPRKRPAASVREGIRRLRQDIAGEQSKAGLNHALGRWLEDFERCPRASAYPGEASGGWRLVWIAFSIAFAVVMAGALWSVFVDHRNPDISSDKPPPANNRATSSRSKLPIRKNGQHAVAHRDDLDGSPKPAAEGAAPSTSQPFRTDIRVNAIDHAMMVYVPAGSFTMGSETGESDEKPVHQVRLTKGFWLYQTPVTHAQYGKFLAAHPHLQPRYWTDSRFDAAQQPVVGVSWQDAKDYCEWAKCRLPTEAEWEYTARGQKGPTFPWGEEEPDASRAVFGQEDSKGRPDVVGSKPAGASWCKALDMAGNVWQWCADWKDETYYARSPSADPPGPESGSSIILRGGAWYDATVYLRASHRGSTKPDDRDDGVGIRPVRASP